MGSKTFLYFAFGSNMLAKRIHINNPSAIKIDIGKLEGYQLEFCNKSERWKGAIASIAEKSSTFMYGVLWELKLEDLQNLDRQEGVHLGLYKSLEVEIETPCGDMKKARTYQIIKPNHDCKIPSWVYLDVMIRGAKENGVPEEYIQKLEKMDHNEYKGEVDVQLDL